MVNSVLVEDILQANTLTNALVYANGNQDVYNKILGVTCGAWKYNTDLTYLYNGYGNNSVSARRAVAGAMYRSGATYNTIPVSIPMSLFFDLCRQSYFPIRNCGAGLQLEFYVEDLRNFMVAALNTAGNPCDVSINISNMHISVDCLTLDSAYLQAMDRIMASPEEAGGYKLAINSYLVADATYSVGPGTTHTQKQLIWSKSSPQLRNMLFWKRNPADALNLANYWVSNFQRLDQGNAAPGVSLGSQLRIGSDLFPQGAQPSPSYIVSYSRCMEALA